MKMDLVLGRMVPGGPRPPLKQYDVTDTVLQEMYALYQQVYYHGLVNFFESRWWKFADSKTNPFITSVKAPKSTLALSFTNFLAGASKSGSAFHPVTNYLELQLVWNLVQLPYTLPQKDNGRRTTLPPEDDGIEVRNRVRVVEALLSNECIEVNPLCPCVSDASNLREREHEFWFNLAEYIRFRDQPHFRESKEKVLANMRKLLDGKENRDVLYSIAITREYGPKLPPDFENSLPPHINESQEQYKVAVANRLLRNQAKPEIGLTNVGRRLAEIAVFAYVDPGILTKKH